VSLTSASGAGLGVPATVLVVGSGGREHALAWRMAGEGGVRRVIVAPGNAGMTDVAEVRPETRSDDTGAIVELCRTEGVDLVVIGPEAPLVAGLADSLRQDGLTVFGPDAGAARIEGSKAFCREVAAAAGVPMAEGEVFDSLAPAIEYARSLGAPLVVKADGLAAGKGVTVCASVEEAERALVDALERRVYGEAGTRVLVERAMDGAEASLMAICDPTAAVALPLARDHKRLLDDDRGPNTGGMGAYSPLADLPDERAGALLDAFHRPVLAELARRGQPFRGLLYAGLMFTIDGPRLLEFNARFGDPETQAVLPRLDIPLAPLLFAAAEDRLAEVAAALGLGHAVRACPDASVCVVLAAEGYPTAPRPGDPISGLGSARADGDLVFAAGVRAGPGGELLTAGGRVLSVVGRGATVHDAAQAAYRAAGSISFDGAQLRRDIGRVPALAGAAA
jgi:phosphoribosylamine---glycine ligase